MPHVLQLAAALLVAGRAYEREGFVFFRGARVHERAGLDRATALELAAAFGDEPDDPMRDDPLDVPVWRPSSERDPAWPSPWGWGRPGWHAECAAMAAATLGSSVDVLVGGEDLTFPHHAYQAAMVEAAVAVGPFARRMLHVGAVHQDGAKMSKSIGNLTLVADLLETAPSAAVRLMLLDRPLVQVVGVPAGGARGRAAQAARPLRRGVAARVGRRGPEGGRRRAAERPGRAAGAGSRDRGRGSGRPAAHPGALAGLRPGAYR